MNIVKCPNPNCPFQFDASLVPAGAVVSCPQCRLQFQLPAYTASHHPPAPHPTVEPADVEPLEADPAPAARRRDEERDDGPARSSSRQRAGRSAAPAKGGMSALIAVVVAGFALVCCGGGVGAGFLLGWFKGKPSDVGDYRFPDYGLTLNGPGDGWAKDEDTRAALGVNLTAFKHSGPEGYVALHARKITSDTGKAQLLPTAKELLDAQFEDLDETFTPVEAKLLGFTGEKYEFTGRYRATGTGCRGEVYAVVARNTLLWVYTWGDRDGFDALAPAFDQFRANLKLDTPKTSDAVKRPAVEFRTNSGLFTLSDAESLWKKQADPTLKDEKGDLLLYGFRRTAGGSLAPKEEAYLVVALLDPDGEAKGQAQKHLLTQFAEGPVVTELEGEPDGDPPAGGPVPASDSVVRLALKYPDADRGIEKLVALTTIDSGGKRVVAYAWCQLSQRAYWEQRLMLLVGTLKGLK